MRSIRVYLFFADYRLLRSSFAAHHHPLWSPPQESQLDTASIHEHTTAAPAYANVSPVFSTPFGRRRVDSNI